MQKIALDAILARCHDSEFDDPGEVGSVGRPRFDYAWFQEPRRSRCSVRLQQSDALEISIPVVTWL